jgi:hypothetical protein
MIGYELDFDRGEYVVRDEEGREMFADPWEDEARRFVEEQDRVDAEWSRVERMWNEGR